MKLVELFARNDPVLWKKMETSLWAPTRHVAFRMTGNWESAIKDPWEPLREEAKAVLKLRSQIKKNF